MSFSANCLDGIPGSGASIVEIVRESAGIRYLRLWADQLEVQHPRIFLFALLLLEVFSRFLNSLLLVPLELGLDLNYHVCNSISLIVWIKNVSYFVSINTKSGYYLQ